MSPAQAPPAHVQIASPIARKVGRLGTAPRDYGREDERQRGVADHKGVPLAGKVIARLFAGTVPEIVTIVGAPAAAGGAKTAAMV